LNDVLNFTMKTKANNTGLRIESSVMDNDPSRLLVTLAGYLDTNNSIFFTDAFTNSIDEYGKARIIVLDIGDLSYVSSTGIGSFVTILAHFKKKNYSMFILHMSDKVRAVFDLLGFTSFFRFIDDTSEISDTPGAKIQNANTIECPSCKKKLKVPHPGKFKCPACASVVIIGEDGRIAV
jgi:anti-sigma B factor antagonist